MNRLNHLQKTIYKNIVDNQDYSNSKFLLLDYSSSDGTAKWVEKELKQFIETGKLLFYRTEGHSAFLRSHSRNMAFRLATTDLVCNIDADNFTGKGFAKYINANFSKLSDVFLTTDNTGLYHEIKDVLGRVCVRKEDFDKIGGYDESMLGYGFEDYDLVNRLQKLGLQKKIISQLRYLSAISHNDDERIVLDPYVQKFIALYIKYITPAVSEVLVLFSDHFEQGTIVDNYLIHADQIKNAFRNNKQYPHSLSEGDWIKGKWNLDSSNLFLIYNDQTIIEFNVEGDYIINDNSRNIFHKKSNPNIVKSYLHFHSDMSNRLRMQTNIDKNCIQVNKNGFGMGTVFFNFSNDAIKI